MKLLFLLLKVIWDMPWIIFKQQLPVSGLLTKKTYSKYVTNPIQILCRLWSSVAIKGNSKKLATKLIQYSMRVTTSLIWLTHWQKSFKICPISRVRNWDSTTLRKHPLSRWRRLKEIIVSFNFMDSSANFVFLVQLCISRVDSNNDRDLCSKV